MSLKVIGLDVGTASVKGLLVDEDGKILCSSSYPLTVNTPAPGWAEQDVCSWWIASYEILNRLLSSGVRKVDAISVSGQMHSLVPLDKHMTPVRQSILWCDQRTYNECSEITELYGGEEAALHSLGNPVLPGFTASKILWMKKHELEIFNSVKKMMLPKDYITFMLSNEATCEPSDASGTAMFDIRKNCYDNKMLSLLGIEESILPNLHPTGQIVGLVNSQVLPEMNGVPVVTGAADNAAAAYGCGVEREGDVMISIGTSGTVVAITDNPLVDESGSIHLFSHAKSGSCYHMAVILSAANSLNWFRERFAPDLSPKEISEIVSSSPAGSNGIVFLPYLSGERTPHRNPSARGVLFGLCSYHSRADVLRSIMEGVAFALRQGGECIKTLGTPFRKVRIVGGGSRSAAWCQIVADNFNIVLEKPLIDEGAAYGSARLAAEAIGVETASWIHPHAETYVPCEKTRSIYDGIYGIYKGLYTDLKSHFDSIAAFQSLTNQ